jgi:tRNA (guanine-N7-)-methyltransferase
MPPPAETLDWRTLFGNQHPVEIEIGFGKGLFLTAAAETHPHVNFLGIEIERKYQLLAANRLAKQALHNVRLACTDARLFLRDRVPAASVQAVHVYFPDPWWKTRHRKRRLFTEAFAAQCMRVLRPGGRLYLVTDVEAYYAEILALLERHPEWKRLPPPLPNEPRHDLDYLTHFERKYRKEARAIHRAVFERQ